MFLQKKIPSPPSPRPPLGGETSSRPDGFDVDLREALAETSVKELSFEEFRRALAQNGKLKTS